MSTVEIRNVRKSYAALEVLHGVDVQIAKGEFVVLVGPSGCGKSTLLRMIAGLEDITGGAIAIDGRVVNNLESKDRDIAMVFQNYALYPQMTVRQNMAFALELAKVPRDVIARKVAETAEILGLEPLLNRKPAQLSGGQRQRVAMGRAIIRDPKVFLFDEPLSNLDAKLRVKMRSEIKALHQRLKTTIVYVTHDQVEAMTMADKIVVMQGGNIEQIGSPLELYDRPRNVFVAGFIGSPAMNFVEGQVLANNGEVVLQLKGADLPMPAAAASLVGRSLLVGIRPEHVKHADDAVAGALECRVSLVEPTGSEAHITLDFAGQELLWILRERLPISRGDVVRVHFDVSDLHLFDPASSERIELLP